MFKTYELKTTKTWNQYDQKLLSFIPDYRINKLEKFKNIISKKTSLYSVLLTEMAISINYKIPYNKQELVFLDNKKPYIKNIQNCYFNYSHSSDTILLGLADNEIGVDVEKIAIPPLEIMNLCFTSQEINYVYSQHDDKAKHTAFYQIWTQKEAYLKFLSTDIKEPNNVNTLDKSINQYFHRWISDEYYFCVYYPNNYPIQQITLDEDYIKNFFINLK